MNDLSSELMSVYIVQAVQTLFKSLLLAKALQAAIFLRFLTACQLTEAHPSKESLTKLHQKATSYKGLRAKNKGYAKLAS